MEINYKILMVMRLNPKRKKKENKSIGHLEWNLKEYDVLDDTNHEDDD